MAIEHGYCALSELKARLDIQDDRSDSLLEDVIEAASRKIDGYCGRRFYAATETRYYTPDLWDELPVDDLVSVTTLKTDYDSDRTYETAWSASDYELDPPNAASDGMPYTRIRVTPTGRYAFPAYQRRSVEVVGSFGWPDVPHAIREATLILASRFHKRKDAPFGIAGNAELGQLTLPANDPDVIRLVADYRRFALVGV